MAVLHDFGRSHPGLSLHLIHHDRKDDRPDEYIDALSGSTGITGAVDHGPVLLRGRGAAHGIVRLVSRDLPEVDTAYAFDGRPVAGAG